MVYGQVQITRFTSYAQDKMNNFRSHCEITPDRTSRTVFRDSSARQCASRFGELFECYAYYSLTWRTEEELVNARLPACLMAVIYCLRADHHHHHQEEDSTAIFLVSSTTLEGVKTSPSSSLLYIIIYPDGLPEEPRLCSSIVPRPEVRTDTSVLAWFQGHIVRRKISMDAVRRN